MSTPKKEKRTRSLCFTYKKVAMTVEKMRLIDILTNQNVDIHLLSDGTMSDNTQFLNIQIDRIDAKKIKP